MSDIARAERRPLDFYPTPSWVVGALLARHPLRPGTRVLDPSAGDGAILDVLRAEGAETSGVELDPQRAAEACGKGHDVAIGDALRLPWPGADALVGNPPFSHARAFSKRAVAWSEANGAPAYLLLRLTFLEPASGRRGVLQESTPDVLILPRRPSFTANGRGDSATSAWFAWPGSGRWEIL